jgi:hypothetical protein
LILATWSSDYIAGLTATRYRGSPGTADARAGINRWIALFAAACVRAVSDATAFEERVRNIQDRWRASLGRVRSGSAAALLIDVLPGVPIITVNGAAALVDRSFQATNEAIRRLEQAGVLKQVNVGRRNRAFEARAIVDAFTGLERQLASPEGDTVIARLDRRVPARSARAR